MKTLAIYLTETKYPLLGDIIFELTEGNRIVWQDKETDALLRMGDHATQREDRPVDKGGDGERIDEKEIVNMFKYVWEDLMDMYNSGELYNRGTYNSFVIQCRCFLDEHKGKIVPVGERNYDKTLWAAFMIMENYKTGKLDIVIRTIFRGEFFKHSRNQECITIARTGYIKRIYHK